MGESGRETPATKFFRLEGKFTEEVEPAGGQKATASGGEGFEGGRIVVQEVDDRVGKFGSKMSERHDLRRACIENGGRRRERLYSEGARDRPSSSNNS